MDGRLATLRSVACAIDLNAESSGDGTITLKLALSTLCENPARPTGLTTLHRELVEVALRLFPQVRWLVFAGPGQAWAVEDPRVEVVRDFPANDRLRARLVADHFRVGPAAAARGAGALITTGFVPLRAPLPVVMQVFTLHHLRSETGGGPLRRWYRRLAVAGGLRRARLVITNSEWAAAELRVRYPDAPAKLLVSPEGLDHAVFQPRAAADEVEELARELGVRRGAVLWLSNFYVYKQAELLVRAYARLPAGLRDRHPLLLVGQDWQGGRGHAEAVARAAGVAREVQFLERVHERWLPALYRQAAVHALPSAEETFGRTVTEAMACGCPCLLNDIPVLREVAAGAAEFVDFRDTAAAASALERILADVGRAEELRIRGTARAAAFSFDRLVRERIPAIVSSAGGDR